ncbi:MAG: hypothetical protein ABW178_01180 [Pseudoxanthomonas sp.]
MTPSDAAPASTRPPPAWLGLVMLAFWLGWMLPSLAALQPKRPVNRLDAPEITRQLRALGIRPGWDGQPLAVRLQRERGRCPCTDDAGEAAVLAALQQQHVRLSRLPTHAETLPYALVVFAADGALRYAGPLDIATGCGRHGVPAGPVIASVLASASAPFLSPDPCPCSEALSV